MPQQPFTPVGVQAKTAELYALSDQMLQQEAASVRADLRAWLNINFILTAAQVSYIVSMDNQFISYTGDTLGLAFQFRLPVNLVAPTPLPPPIISKMVELEPKLTPVYNEIDGLTAAGEVIITITY